MTKTYISQIFISVTWGQVTSMTSHYKSMGKYWNPSHSKDMHPLGENLSGSCPWIFMIMHVQVLGSDPAKGHLRSPKVKKSLLLITFDWEVRETWEWAHWITSRHIEWCPIWTVWVKLGHHVTLTCQILKLTFQGHATHVSTRLDEKNTMVPKSAS